ncbi:uncharacterized protein DS421_16g547270 [Arachis hypogaea]|nr:uncharacterized protein DS421_16g547270 [Arachis hypogaea]
MGLGLKGPIVKGKESGLRFGYTSQGDWADENGAGQNQVRCVTGSGVEPGRVGGSQVHKTVGKRTLKPQDLGMQGVRECPDARGVKVVGAGRAASISRDRAAAEAHSSMARAGRGDHQRAAVGDGEQGRTRQLEGIRERTESEEEGHVFISFGNRSTNPAHGEEGLRASGPAAGIGTVGENVVATAGSETEKEGRQEQVNGRNTVQGQMKENAETWALAVESGAVLLDEEVDIMVILQEQNKELAVKRKIAKQKEKARRSRPKNLNKV